MKWKRRKMLLIFRLGNQAQIMFMLAHPDMAFLYLSNLAQSWPIDKKVLIFFFDLLVGRASLGHFWKQVLDIFGLQAFVGRSLKAFFEHFWCTGIFQTFWPDMFRTFVSVLSVKRQFVSIHFLCFCACLSICPVFVRRNSAFLVFFIDIQNVLQQFLYWNEKTEKSYLFLSSEIKAKSCSFA